MVINHQIQGLRALAVLAVVIAHLQTGWLTGGFVGVDIFFVISGYLITAMLAREIEDTGGLRFTHFYARRFRRLFPALAVTCLVTMLAGFLILGDEELERVAVSAVSSFFSVSNVYFWSQSGYFDADAITKPLLNTWSLGVEEQFYLFWPLLLMFSLKGKSKQWGVCSVAVLGALSFALNWLFAAGHHESLLGKVYFSDGQTTAFYMMPFRIFEFALGALVYLLGLDRRSLPGNIANTLTLLCLSVLLFLMFTLTEKSVFPSSNALWVALSSAGLIVASSHSRIGQSLFANTPMVFIGGISYSLYLVHWPLVVYTHKLFGSLTLMGTAALCITMLVSALVLNILVERRFRYPPADLAASGSKTLFGAGMAAALGGSLLCVILLAMYEGRVPANRAIPSAAEWPRIARERYCSDAMPDFPATLFTCQLDRGAKHTVFVWGDSHAHHLAAGVAELYADSNLAIAYLTDCPTQSGFQGYVRKKRSTQAAKRCIARNRELLRWLEQYEGEATVFISNAKRGTPGRMAAINNEHIALIGGYGHDAYVLADFIRPGVELANCFAVPDYLLDQRFLETRCQPDTERIQRELKYNRKLARDSVNFIPVHLSQCPGEVCNFFDGNGRVNYRDSHHLSYEGAIYELAKARHLIERYVEPQVLSCVSDSEGCLTPP